MHINASNMLELQGPVIAKNLTIALSYKQYYKCLGMKSQFVYRELFLNVLQTSVNALLLDCLGPVLDNNGHQIAFTSLSSLVD